MPHLKNSSWSFGRMRLIFCVMSLGSHLFPSGLLAVSPLVLWDSDVPLTEGFEGRERGGWRLVPNDLMQLEKNPPKAASDPGYYGREYSFRGDAVVQNRHCTTVFSSASGRVYFLARSAAVATLPDRSLGLRVVEWRALDDNGKPYGRISGTELIRHAGDEVRMKVTFANVSPPPTKSNTIPTATATFGFDKSEGIEITPADDLTRIQLVAPLAYGIAPSFIGDDLIYGLNRRETSGPTHILADSFFLGLLAGEETEFVLTWPQANQRIQVQWDKDSSSRSGVPASVLEFSPDHQSFYLATLRTRGIWHQEVLKAAYLEADVKSSWRRPFPAKWKTQLDEADVKTTFSFRQAPGEIWRGVPGSYRFPVWFEGDQAFFHFSKKIPPKGLSLIYFLEGQETPAEIATPVDVLKSTLGRVNSDRLLDVPGRKLRTHHRRGGDGVHRACTCGCTEAIQAIFEAREEVERKPEIQGAVEDMIFFVQQHVARIDEYRKFSADLVKYLRDTIRDNVSAPVKAYVENLEPIALRISTEYDVQKENLKSPEYMADLTRQTLALADHKDPENLKAYLKLLDFWRAMGGAQDYVVAQFNTVTRKLGQEAGYGMASVPQASSVAREIRYRCQQILRNPDGYELWPDY